MDDFIVINKLMECYEEYLDDKIIRWKITMALSAFNSDLVISRLKLIADDDNEQLIRKEAIRS
jgi:hypothetical protein